MIELLAVVRFVHLTAAVLLVGGFSFALLVARPAYTRIVDDTKSDYLSFLRLQLRIARWCLVAIFASAWLGLWLQTLIVSESSTGVSFDANEIFILLAETQYGKVWLARMALVLFLGALLWVGPKRIKIDAIAFLAINFGLSACLLASLALAGHASAAEGTAFVIQVSADALHLLASGTWLGGLAPLAALLRQCSHRGDTAAFTVARSATRRFSCLALVNVGVLIATGGYNAWNLVGGFAPLFGTAYGKLLLLKIGLLLPLLGIGAINLLWLKPRIVETVPNQPEQSAVHLRRLTRNVTTELLVGTGILLIVGYMGVTPPARHVQPDWPFSFRWDWSIPDKAPKAGAEVNRGMIWAVIGGAALLAAVLRRGRRVPAAVVGIAAMGYAVTVIDTAVSIDAYSTTYKRPSVAYHAISVANGKWLYEESSCGACHGPSGYGDGPLAPDLRPRPVDLTAPHANLHTAGDLYWWISYGVRETSMPGFGQSLSEDERWDLINFMRLLSSGERARNLAPVIENEPSLAAPDFTYGTNTGETKMLKDHRGDRIVLLVLLDLQGTAERLQQLTAAWPRLQAAGVEVIVIPNLIDYLFVADKLPGLIVNEGIREISETYKLFARSFADEGLITGTRHVEFLIDKQGYIRARWLPAEGDAWRNLDRLLSQVELLRKEKSRAPAPDEHVH